MPSPEPIGEPSGITATQPTCSRRWATIRSSEVYAQTSKPRRTSSSAAREGLGRVRQQRDVVADHLELDQRRREGLARQLGHLDGLFGAEAARGIG